MGRIELYGSYYLTKKIATGGMAELFRARRKVGLEGFEKILAIKRILPHLGNNEDFVAMFADEARIVAQLTHQNIVQIFDFGKLNESYFIAMEFVLGSNLRRIMEKTRQLDTRLSVNDSVLIITKAAIGLDYAHRKRNFQNRDLNIIHRDISPQNILVSYEGEVKLTDFGIAKAALTTSVTQTGILKGKVSYMSPEQARGEVLDRRSDIFSLGAIFYELLTYRKLFEGESELKILDKLKDPQIEPPSKVNQDIPLELDRIVLKALATRAEDRYQSAEEMYAACEAFLASRDDFSGTNGFRNFLRIVFREDIEREEQEVREEFDRVRSLEGKQKKARFVAPHLTCQGSSGISPLSRWKDVLWTVRHTIAVIGFLVLGFFLFLSFSTRAVQSTKKPRTADDHVRYALLCLGQSRFDRATQAFEKAFKMEPSYAIKYQKQLAKLFLKRGNARLAENVELAIRDFQAAQELDPENHEIYFQLGRAYTKCGKYDDALNQYEQSLALSGDNPDAHFNLGYIFLARKEYASAAKEFEEAVKLKPPYLSDAYVNLGIAYYNGGHLEKGLAALKKALGLNPKDGKISTYIDAVKAQLRKRGS
jgi:serine/threonine protein kinase/cytochrome c-type biogenesis protein CcmH/NrfG